MKKAILSLCSICVMLGLLFCLSYTQANGFRFTQDIRDYGTEKFPLYHGLFPRALPAGGEAVAFSYYNYWHEEEDYYLELKFSTREEMDNYLSAFAKDCGAPSFDAYVEDGFRSEQNPYDPTFVDWIDLFCITISGGREYTGFSIYTPQKRGETLYDCNFGVISCSYEKLTVIHSYTTGVYQYGINDHIPCYFQRFHVPLEEEHERKIFLDR